MIEATLNVKGDIFKEQRLLLSVVLMEKEGNNNNSCKR